MSQSISRRTFTAAALAAALHAADGWRPLFDGRSPAGWIEITGKPFPSNCWKVENGCLTTLLGSTGMQDIRTVETFAPPFEFRFEWRIGARANSGVKYLVQKTDEWTRRDGRQARARGLEYQICDDSNPEVVADPRRGCGSLYSYLAPAGKPPVTLDRFHRSRIVVTPSRAEHWLDGVRIVEFAFDSASAREAFRQLRKGLASPEPGLGPSPLALQHHGTEISFRGLEIRTPAP